MKAQTQVSDELRHLCQLIAPISVAMLTSLDGEGHMESHPMSPLEMDGSGAIWFLTDLRSLKAEHLQVLNLGFADVGNSTYVSLSGSGELCTERAAIERLWTEFARPWFPDGVESEHVALLKFTPVTAKFWDAPNSKMVRMLAMAASIAAQKPVGGIGNHATLKTLKSGKTSAGA